jgi:ABC-type ATPase involved in cell division
MNPEKIIHRMSFENLSFSHDKKHVLFENVNFDFPLNEFVWLRAPSGHGRSSLLLMLAALQMPEQGRYWINDSNVAEMSFEEFLPYRLRIGFGFDMGGLIYNRTLFDNIMLPLSYHNRIPYGEARDRVNHLFKYFEIERHRDLRPSFVSGGLRKLACVIRAIAIYPELLLLDDPSVGLGHEHSLKLSRLLNDLKNQGLIHHIYMSSYDEKFISEFPHRTVEISKTALTSREDNKAVA